MVRFGRSTGVITTGPSSVNHHKGIVVNDTAAAAMVRRDRVATGCATFTAADMESATAADAAIAIDAAVTGCTSPTHWRHLV